MRKKIYDLAFALHNAIESHPDVLLLKKLEDKISKESTILKLGAECEKLQSELNNLLEYLDIESREVKVTRQKLTNYKYELDTHPLVQEYNLQHKKVSKIYEHVSKTLFHDFCNKRGCLCQ